MIEASQGKTYTRGMYDLLPSVQKDVNAAKWSGIKTGFNLTGKIALLAAAGIGLYLFKDELKGAIRGPVKAPKGVLA